MKVSLTCKCGKLFQVWPYRLKRTGARASFCSQNCYHQDKLGSKLSDITKKRMSQAHGQPIWLLGKEVWNKGKKGLQEAWNKDKVCPQLRGENHHNWQGGITPEVRRIRNSTEYKQWRLEVFKRDKFTCQFCKQLGGKLEADHIKPFSLFKELRLVVSNGRTLCKECHKLTPTYLNGAKSFNYGQ